MGSNMTEPTTDIKIDFSLASNPSSSILNVTTLITDLNNMSSTIPVNLEAYNTVEDLIAEYPNITDPVILFRKEDDAYSGVSTVDISLIVKHVLGIQLFDQSYKLEAADVNRDDHVSAIDLSTLTKIVLGINPFPSDVWLFDPPHVKLIVNPGNTLTISTLGIKIGDVN